MSEYFRIATIEDAKALVEIYRPYVEETAITFEYEVPTIAEFAKRIENTLQRYPYIVVEDENQQILGYAHAGVYKGRSAYDWSVEVTVYLKVDVKGRRLGRKLYEQLEQYLKRQNVLQLTACITAGNQESEVFHEKMGYKKVALFEQIGYKFNQWYDICWMQKTLAPLPKQPANFIPFSQLAQ